MEPIEFKKRRQKLLKKIGPNSIAIIPTAPVYIRNNDVEHPYRPDSDFYYLTGFPEPEAVAVLSTVAGQNQYLLFNRERDQIQEIWNGHRAGQEGACTIFGADDAYPISQINSVLPDLLQKCERIYYALGLHPDLDLQLTAWLNKIRRQGRSGTKAPREIIRLDQILHEMRLFKSKEEIIAMRKAAEISSLAHMHAMAACKPGMYEYQIEAYLQHDFLYHGCKRPAYSPIIAAGPNSCILHYHENNEELRDGELLLIDAGGEYDYYAADITRTFPINGEFNKYQAALYEVVLAAQVAAIDAVKPGNHWNQPHEAAVETITMGLVELGLLKGKIKPLLQAESHKPYYMHRTGHWLGMDVHDVGNYKTGEDWRELEPGMVLTVEPGIYISAGHKGVAKKWCNIGIRIEDDVLVTATGNDVLSKNAPKTIEAIQHIMSQH